MSLILFAVWAAAPADVWPPSFFEGMQKLRTLQKVPTATSCRGCHVDEYDAWFFSRHSVSATNDLFLDGLRAEPNVRCVNCHAPHPQQSHEGITCATCHVRENAVLSANSVQSGVHPVRSTPFLRDSEFCAVCHEFSSHQVIDGKTTLVDLPMQSTFSEWKKWRAAGGQGTCQSCHMPEGSHTFRGAHDLSFLRESLLVEVRSNEIILSSRGVGHLYPTGDVFRHLRVWAVVDGKKVEVARLERKTKLVRDGGSLRQVVLADTRLWPGEPRRFSLPPHTTRVVVTYHKADDKAELRARVSFDELVQELVTIDVE